MNFKKSGYVSWLHGYTLINADIIVERYPMKRFLLRWGGKCVGLMTMQVFLLLSLANRANSPQEDLL